MPVNTFEWLINEMTHGVRDYVRDNSEVTAHVETQVQATAEQLLASPASPAALPVQAPAVVDESSWVPGVFQSMGNGIRSLGKSMLWASTSLVYDYDVTAQKVKFGREMLDKVDKRLAASRIYYTADANMEAQVTDLLREFAGIHSATQEEERKLLRSRGIGPRRFDQNLGVFEDMLRVSQRDTFITLLSIVLCAEKAHSGVIPATPATSKKKAAANTDKVATKCLVITQELLSQLMQWAIALHLDDSREKNIAGHVRQVPYSLSEALLADIGQAITNLNNFNNSNYDAEQRHDNYLVQVNSLIKNFETRNDSLAAGSNTFTIQMILNMKTHYEQESAVQAARQRLVA